MLYKIFTFSPKTRRARCIVPFLVALQQLPSVRNCGIKTNKSAHIRLELETRGEVSYIQHTFHYHGSCAVK